MPISKFPVNIVNNTTINGNYQTENLQFNWNDPNVRSIDVNAVIHGNNDTLTIKEVVCIGQVLPAVSETSQITGNHDKIIIEVIEFVNPVLYSTYLESQYNPAVIQTAPIIGVINELTDQWST
jgi:hypothetical protein